MKVNHNRKGYYYIIMNPKQENTAFCLLPSIFKSAQESVCFQFKIIFQFLLSNFHQISSHKELLSSKYNHFNSKYQEVQNCLKENLKYNQISNIQKDCFYYVLSCYNHSIRLKRSFSQLIQFQNSFKIVPPPTPCQYVDTSLWRTQSEEVNQNNWIGHGYYWKRGDGVTKDNYNGDYNTIQGNYCRLKEASIVIADYQLLKSDFHFLQQKSEQDINNWLLQQTAYLSEGQIRRIQKNGDLNLQLDVSSIDKIIDFQKTKAGFRYRGGGRATNFLINDQFKIEGDKFKAQFINVKGVGSQKIITGFTEKQNGLLSMPDALKEYTLEKLFNKIALREKQAWGTVQTYAIIDIGISYNPEFESPATGYKGDKLALIVRQGSSRFEYSYDQMCYYSVIPENLLLKNQSRCLLETLVKYGISSQQEPLAYFQQNFQIQNLSGSWNIQSDATLQKFVDYSQFYVLPNSMLPVWWRMSENALLDGTIANKFALKRLMKNKKLLLQNFKTENENEINQICDQRRKSLIEKYGEKNLVGQARKPKYCWSWFLETDDSEVSKFCLEQGLSKNLNKKEIRERISFFLSF